MTKELFILNEPDLRFRITDQHAQVYFMAEPRTVLGSQYLGKVADIDDHLAAWEMIDRYLGHLMPADMVEEEYLDLFDGVAYIGGGFAFVSCPHCGASINGDDLQMQVGHDGCDAICPNCRTQLVVIRGDRIRQR